MVDRVEWSYHDDPLESAAAMVGQLARLEADQYDYLAHYLTDCADDPGLSTIDGGERRFAYGGAGTPAVPEFAVTQVQVSLRLSPWAAQKLVADVMSLTYRLPGVLTALRTGQAEAWRCRMVAGATRDLPLAVLQQVQDQLLEGGRSGDPLISRITRKRLAQLLEQFQNTADADAAASVADEVAHWLSQRDINIRPGEAGTSVIGGSLSTADGERLTQRLSQVASWLRELGDTRTLHELCSVAMGMLADTGTVDNLYDRVCAFRAGQDLLDHDPLAPPESRRPVPATVVYVHHQPAPTQPADDASGAPSGHAPAASGGGWSLDRHGALTAAEARDLVGHSHVTVKPMIDLAEPIVCPGYVASPRLREQLALMNAGLCTFPYCDRPAMTGDYDHETPYPRGPTSTANGHLPCRRHHRAKTHANWEVWTILTGVWLWRAPTGRHYLVTGGTTTPLD